MTRKCFLGAIVFIDKNNYLSFGWSEEKCCFILFVICFRQGHSSFNGLLSIGDIDRHNCALSAQPCWLTVHLGFCRSEQKNECDHFSCASITAVFSFQLSKPPPAVLHRFLSVTHAAMRLMDILLACANHFHLPITLFAVVYAHWHFCHMHAVLSTCRKLPLKEENGKESLKPDMIEIKLQGDRSIHAKPEDSKA